MGAPRDGLVRYLPTKIVGVDLRLLDSSGWLPPKRFELHHSIALARAGAIELSHQGTTAPFSPGALCLLAPGEVFGAVRLRAAQFCGTLLEIDEAVIADAALALRRPRPAGAPLALRAPVHEEQASPQGPSLTPYALASELAHVAALGGPALQQEVLLHALLARLIIGDDPAFAAGQGRAAEERDVIEQALATLRLGFRDNVTLGQLAAPSGWSTFHFLHVFTSLVGVSPHRYLTLVRVARARALIRDGMALAAVATAVGLVDQSHLSRHFSRIYGLTPGRFARQIRKDRFQWRD